MTQTSPSTRRSRHGPPFRVSLVSLVVLCTSTSMLATARRVRQVLPVNLVSTVFLVFRVQRVRPELARVVPLAFRVLLVSKGPQVHKERLVRGQLAPPAPKDLTALKDREVSQAQQVLPVSRGRLETPERRDLRVSMGWKAPGVSRGPPAQPVSKGRRVIPVRRGPKATLVSKVRQVLRDLMVSMDLLVFRAPPVPPVSRA